MESIALGQTGRQTSKLGYGCSRLMGSVGRKESLALLEAAFDAGVRHFDVAPAYGHGLAEGCVGEFLSRHCADCTVATKHGVPTHTQSGLKATVRRMAVPLIELVPGLKQKLQKASAPAPASAPAARESLPFTAEAVQASIERSLTQLRTDHIDLFLLHEVEAPDLTDDRLLRLLEDLTTSGKIGTFGVASGGEKIPALVERRPAYCRVLQHEWSVLDPLIPPGTAFRVLHRSLTLHFPELHAALLADTPRARRWSEFCGADVTDGETLARLMLKASAVANPASVILFSSKKPQHIRKNTASLDVPGSADQAMRFYSLVRAEAAEVIPGTLSNFQAAAGA